jgi:enoyl-CoA hydratase
MSVLLRKAGARATITLNRPKQLNAINDTMPRELRAAVEDCGRDDSIRVVVLEGAGKGFCGGYDLHLYAETKGRNFGWQESDVQPFDIMQDYAMMRANTDDFMSLFRLPKPVICKVHGSGAVAGGSDIALCCDFIIMSETARIGYPPARVWGCPTTANWVQKVGPTHAKRMLLTGELIAGVEAFRIGLATAVVPEADIDAEVDRWVRKMENTPANQLAMHKLLVNTAIEQQGLQQQQTLATLFDGFARHSPEGAQFKRLAEKEGWKAAVAKRDARDTDPKSKL